MTLQLFLSILAFIGIIIGLLFLSMIHLFMIPKDVMDRDTGKSQKPEEPTSEPKPQPEMPPTPRPTPEVEQEPGVFDEPEPEVERPPSEEPAR